MKKPTKTIAEHHAKTKVIADIKAKQEAQFQKVAGLAALTIPIVIKQLADIEVRMQKEGADLEDLKAKKAKTEEKLARFQELAKNSGLLKKGKK